MPRFSITRAAHKYRSFNEKRDISDLDGLLALIKEFGHDIIISSTIFDKSVDYDIVIYDDYVE